VCPDPSRGAADAAYPFPWAVYEWIDGAPYGDDAVDDERQAARDLARFVLELRRIDPTGAPPGGRGRWPSWT
jgi:aminoglycoside phosphotransferase (APT) family kinase protein